MKVLFKYCLGIALLMVSGLWLSTASAQPSYSRGTGMDCDSCHIGFQAVPDFTRDGRLFILRGFQQPNSVNGKFREDGFDANGNDTPTYGGNYLALNWQDYLSARFNSTIASGGVSSAIGGGGAKQDTQSNPGARFCMYFTGPITDWLGVWDEVGYLGNNSLKAANSTTVAGETVGNATNLNFYAYDEYRLTTSKMLSDGYSFIAMAFGNEYPDAINEFVFPANQIRPWGYGQGGAGTEFSDSNISWYAFLDNHYLLQYSLISGDEDTSFSNGHNTYVALAYNGIPGTGDNYNRESDDVWWLFDGVMGNNVGSQINSTSVSFDCSGTGTCPAGITSLGFSNSLGSNWGTIGDLSKVNGTGKETVVQSYAYRLRVDQAVADDGNYTWYQGAAYACEHQSYVSGALSNHCKLGYQNRWWYNRTYGVDVALNRDTKFTYTTSAGVQMDVGELTAWSVEFLWAPAMNINFGLNYSPSKTNVILPADYATGGYSWSLLIDYSF